MMTREDNSGIVRYTLEEIIAMNREGRTRTDWARIEAMTEEEIERNAREENAALGIPDNWYKGAEVARAGEFPEFLSGRDWGDESDFSTTRTPRHGT
jgi:hypothetical protein